MELLEGGPVRRVHRSNLRPYVEPVPKPRQPRHTASPVDRPTLRESVCLELETESMDPEFVLVEEIRYPVAEQVATLEPEDVDLITDKSEGHPESVMEREDVLEQETGDMPDVDSEAELGPSPHPTSECISSPPEETDARPVPAPRKRREDNVRVNAPIPSPRRSERTTAGTHKNPFNLPRSACNTVTPSPDVFSQVLAGVVLYTSQFREQ